MADEHVTKSYKGDMVVVVRAANEHDPGHDPDKQQSVVRIGEREVIVDDAELA